MERLTDLFARVLSMGWTALPVMGVVAAARLLLRRAPKRYAYLLWAVVAFRLVCPVTVSTPVGLVAPETARRQVEAAGEAVREAPAETARPVLPETGPRQDVPGSAAPGPAAPSPSEKAPARGAPEVLEVLAAVWLAGAGAMAGYVLWSFLRLRRLVETAVRREGNVWECGNLPTPFVLGLVRPRIYIPFYLGDAERTYVLAHEREHLRWRDPWAKALALGILTVYWWHPGVWLCWVLLCRDMELRCDEAVLAALGDGIKQDYSRSLVSFALNRRFPAALAFGEHDAARRVKHVLAWKRAKGPVIFLALAAVVMVTAVCGTNAMDRNASWIKGARRFPGLPARYPGYRYQISREYKSFLVYQERYDRGVLTERKALAYGGFGTEEGQVPWRGTCSLVLDMDEVPGMDGVSHFLGASWKFTLNEGAEVSFPAVPKGVYGGASTHWSSRDLEGDSPVISAALSLREGEDWGDPALPDEEGFLEKLQENDITLILRLRLSGQDPETLWAEFEAETLEAETGEREGDALAQRLYSAERTPEAVLDVLGAEETLGRYTLEDAPRGYLSLLFYDCPEPLPDRDTAMWKYSMVLLALLEDYDETTWNWIDGGEKVRETNGGLWNTREWLNANGLGKPIREYGKSPEALRLLLGTLYPQYGGGAEVSRTGVWLAALGQDLPVLLEALVEPVLGDVSWTLAGEGPKILEISLTEPLGALRAADGGEGILSDLSCLLLALADPNEIWSIRWLDGGAPVEFSSLHGGDQFMDNAGFLWTEHRSGDGLYVPACGQSAAGMTLLAECLGAERFLDGDALRAAAEARASEVRVTRAAENLFRDASEDAPDLLIEDLVCWALWGDTSFSGKYRKTLEQGTLLLEFPTDGGDGNRLDQNMARNAAVLLKLRPELSAVRWTYPYGDGTMERTFDTGSLASVICLSSNSAVYRQPQSASDVQALLRFLLNALKDQVYTAALEGREIPRQTPFTDVLGYDGFLWDLREGFFFSRTWYAVEEGREPFAIASAYGYDPPEAWELDLDGDGREELVCNYVTGGDGHPGVQVYQRREDGVYEGHLDTRDLPGHNNWGLNSTWERYDPETGRFVIGYDAGRDGEREASFSHEEALARMEWFPYAVP